MPIMERYRKMDQADFIRLQNIENKVEECRSKSYVLECEYRQAHTIPNLHKRVDVRTNIRTKQESLSVDIFKLEREAAKLKRKYLIS